MCPSCAPVLEHPSIASSFLDSGPANFLYSSLSVSVLFVLLPLSLAHLNFLICLSILHAPSFCMSTSQMLAVVFAHSVDVSKSLHHKALRSTQNHFSSLFLSSFSKGPQKMLLFPFKAPFAIPILSLTTWQQFIQRRFCTKFQEEPSTTKTNHVRYNFEDIGCLCAGIVLIVLVVDGSWWYRISYEIVVVPSQPTRI